MRIMLSEQNIKTNATFFSRMTFYVFCKRLIDIVVSLVVLIILAPLYVVISYLIYRREGRTILFRERRAGKDNQTFIMWTFRTKTNQSQVIRTLAPRPVPLSWENGVPNQFHLKTYGYRTLTQTGIFLRKYRLHKIPQFIHVLKGDMSLVGPETEIPLITAHYNAYQAKRQKVKPGITGYAQIKGYSNNNHHQKIASDMYYINHFSFKLDLKIMFRALIRIRAIN